jgi:predicted actin-binding protein
MGERPKNGIGRRALVALTAFAALVGVVAAGAGARTAAAPQNTAAPAVSGTAKVGGTLTADHGTWSGSPTGYTYQWQRCTSDGATCGDLNGATDQTYKPVTGDVGHALRVVVTAANADGKSSATSKTTDVVDSASGPDNTVKPTIAGTAAPGETLTVSTGSWSSTVRSYTIQWQSCASDGTCRNVSGASGRTYGVRSADVDHTLRALVTAHTAAGQTTVTSASSDVVKAAAPPPPVTTTKTVQGNKAPVLRFLSLRRVGARVYARFRVCDDKPGRQTITERDNKARALSYARRFAVTPTLSCGTYSRSWTPAKRFRTRGRYVVTLRASDKSGALSRLVSRSLVKR